MIQIKLPSGALLGEVSATEMDAYEPGKCGRVVAVRGAPRLRRRLMEMGFVSGTHIRIVRLAPFGDPMQIELHGYHISLRRAEARTVLVEPC